MDADRTTPCPRRGTLNRRQPEFKARRYRRATTLTTDGSPEDAP